jgi:signal transduction histidine kinase/ligand-binding sensor domain-containing protein/DNA-binding response OmpR family regulator
MPTSDVDFRFYEKKLVFLLLIIVGFHFLQLDGQKLYYNNTDLNFKHLSSRDGLSQRSITDIMQDKDGYLWFGTRDGLNRYDGSNFLVFRHDSEKLNSLTHSWVTSIYQDTKKNIWVGTKDGLNKYNPELQHFIPFKHPDNPLLNDNVISGIAQFNDSTLCISTNKGIGFISLVEEKFLIPSHILKWNMNELSDKRTRDIIVTRDGALWICTIEGVDMIKPGSDNFLHYPYPANTRKEIRKNNSPTLFEDRYGTIWLGYEGGLAHFDALDNSFKEYSLQGHKSIISAVRTICEDSTGNLWIGTYTGLYILNTRNNSVHQVTHNKNNPKSLSQNSIYKIIQDYRGDMWIGTWAGGINYYDKSYAIFDNIIAGESKSMLNYGVVSAIIEDDQGPYLWVGTEGGGINLYNKKSNSFSYYTHDPTDPNSLSSNNVKSILKDSQGNLWVGTHDDGVNFLNPNKRPFQFKKIKAKNTSTLDLSNYRILSLFEDRDGKIWIGTLTGGIMVYDPGNQHLMKLQETTKSIQCIVDSPAPGILIAGGSDGLELINTRTFEIEKVNFGEEQKYKEYLKEIRCIYIDEEKDYWVGTEGYGLFHYDSEHKQVIKYGVSDGLPNEIIYGILKDNNHHLWISTNEGISQFNINSGKFKNFTESDGLQSNEFNYNAFARTADGHLIFGGVNGLTIFNPEQIQANTYIPPIDLSGITINNDTTIRIVDSVSKIFLTHKQNNFSVHFTALSYSQPDKNQFTYKLEGFDEDWIHIGNNKTATYTNVLSGNYRFKVKASNNDGFWNEEGDSIHIQVLPAPWKTWWAFLIYGLLTSSLMIYIRTLVLARMESKKLLEEERLNKEKIEEINKLKLKFFTNISHEFRTPLTLIIGPLQRLITQSKNDPQTASQLQIIQRNAYTLLQLINQLLDFRKSEEGRVNLQVSKNDIVSFIEDIKLSFEGMAISNRISFSFKHNIDRLEVWYDEVEFKKVIINILSNAFKFTPPNGQIDIELQAPTDTSKQLKIQIKDTGIGIPQKYIESIFDPYYQLASSNKKRGGTGLGLSLVKDIIDLHHGEIHIESSPGVGVLFTITLPMGKDQLSSNEIMQNQDDSKYSQLENFDPSFFTTEVQNSDSDINHNSINDQFSTLLIVEDNVELRNFIKTIFNENYNIWEANHGKEGLQMAQNKQPDLIISDVMMPVMDGVEFCQNIKSNIKTSHIPVLLLTAKASLEFQKEGFKSGADVYLPKPFDAQILEFQVNNLINLRKKAILKFKKETLMTPKELTTESIDEKFLLHAFEIVEDQLANEDFNAETFTKKMGVSRTLLYNKLKVLTGMSVTEFIRSIRIKKATQLIEKTNMTISEIAYSVGFNDLKYFRANFKKAHQHSPSEFRKIKKKATDPNIDIK